MEISELVKTLLNKRGIVEDEAIERFLTPDYARDVHDPLLLSGMQKAVTRILKAIAANERIAVYADFDCDGIPGAALLSDFFSKIEYEYLNVYIPHRDREGYGFHTAAIETLEKRGVSLIITVDVGGSAIEQVRFAKERGIDVIVTDHHEIMGELPKAAAVVNPKLGDYPFKDLCGTGVAWKLVCALIVTGKKRNLKKFTAIPDGWEKWLLDLVAIATVADLVPLVGENRALAYFGLTVLRKSQRAGIRALCASARVKQANLSEDDIAFTFAPRVNAASRMDEPELAFKLLSTKDEAEAEALAATLESLNRKRRSLVASVVREAKARVAARYTDADRMVVLGDTEWKPALMGLCANSIMESRGGGIVCMWGRDANGKLKGSCRSDGRVSVVDMFTKAKDALEEFGGHHASGGFSVSHESVHTLPERLAEAARELSAEVAPKEAREPDAELLLPQISTNFFRDFSRLAPFGMGNPKPLFRVHHTQITFTRRFGKENNHTEVLLVCRDTGMKFRAFQFFRSPQDFTLVPEADLTADLLATVERDAFKGEHALALRISDVVHPR